MSHVDSGMQLILKVKVLNAVFVILTRDALPATHLWDRQKRYYHVEGLNTSLLSILVSGDQVQ